MENILKQLISTVLMLLQMLACQCQQTFYIRPTGSSSCPHNVSNLQCKDLHGFVSESQFLSLNTSLLFLLGHHYLNETLFISDTAEFTMAPYTGNSSDGISVENGARIQITCLGYEGGGISIDNVVHVRIDSIEFHLCGHYDNRHGNPYEVLMLRSVQYSVITNSIWNKSRSSAIFMSNCNIILLNCHILETVCYPCKCGGVCAHQSNITLKGHNVVLRNRVATLHAGGGGLYLVNSYFYLYGSLTVVGNTVNWGGGGISMFKGHLFSSANSSLYIAENICIRYSKISSGGLLLNSVNVHLAGSTTCSHNSVIKRGGGIHIVTCTCNITGFVLLHNNTAGKHGGGLYINDGEVMIGNAVFSENSAEYGGGLSLHNAKFTVLKRVTFSRNIAVRNGGATYATSYSTIIFLGNTLFSNNSADVNGGAMSINEGARTLFMNTEVAEFFGNNAKSGGGGLDVRSSSMLEFKCNVAFTHNSAREGGALNVALSSTCVFKRGSEAIFTDNRAKSSGGSINIFMLSNIISHSLLNISSSHAGRAGGGIALKEAEIFLHGRTFLEDNEADTFGGAIVLEYSNLNFHGSSVMARNIAHYGGALHAMNSNIAFSGNHSFSHNFGQSGGGWSFDVSSYFSCLNASNIVFDSNHASQHGGAMWIEDSPLYSCIEDLSRTCFFRAPLKCNIAHYNNTATVAGAYVYGGHVDNCIVRDTHNNRWGGRGHTNDRSTIAFNKMFHPVQNNSTMSLEISSDPTRVCLCRDDERDCSLNNHSIVVFSGEQFGLSLVGVGQRNGTVPAVILARSDPSSNLSVQISGSKCSMVFYTLSTTAHLVRLMIFPESTCNYFSTVNVSAIIRPCPPVFRQYNDTESCTCEVTMKELKVQCDITSQSFSHEHGVWVSFSQPQFNSSQSSEISVLILYHSHCPLDYCSSKHVNFTYNSTDKQCRYDRQGILCGACKTGYSLNLGGSSYVPQCSFHYLLLFLIFAVAGVALVVFLLTLGLTVSAGTLNGLIFFANIIGTNSTIFIPPEGASFLRVFIAWLNLDFGIHTCLFPGLDMYTKVWLQFAFPLYVWVLIGVIIVASHHSVLVTRWLGR